MLTERILALQAWAETQPKEIRDLVMEASIELHKKEYPEMGTILSVPFQRCACVVTSMNLAMGEGTSRLFPSYTAADDWLHDTSKSQVPAWHEKYCARCLKERK